MLALLLFALILRLVGVQSRSIWYDEAFSILFAQQSPAQILGNTLSQESDSSAAEEHPPLYYIVLWGWFKIFGASIFSARLFSILLSLLVILLIHEISKELFGPTTALTAAALTGLLPFQIHYGQEIRMYSMLALWITLATFAFLRARNGPKIWWGVFAVAVALAQYTHNLAAIHLMTLALTPVFQRDWKTLRSVTLAGLCAVLLYLPWMLQLPAQFAKVSSAFWVEKPGFERVFTLILYYLPHLPLPRFQLMAGFFLSMMTIALAGFQTYLGRKNNIPSTRPAMWTVWLAFMPPLLLWGVSQVVPVYIERALLPAHGMFCIWLAWAFTQTRAPRPIQGVAAVFILFSAGMGIFQHATYNGFPYGPYAEVNENIQNQIQSGDVVIHSSKLSYLPAFANDPGLPQAFIVDPANSNVDTLSPSVREAFHLVEYESIESATQAAERVWFIIFRQSVEEYTAEGYVSHPHLQYLDENFSLQTVEEWADLRIYIYTQP